MSCKTLDFRQCGNGYQVRRIRHNARRVTQSNASVLEHTHVLGVPKFNTRQRVARSKRCTKRQAFIDGNVKSTFNIPGLEKIVNSPNNWHKFVWIACALAFYGVCTYQLIDRVTFYFEAPIAFDITIQKLTSIEMPTVTICPPFGSIIVLYKLWKSNKLWLADDLYTGINFTLDDVWNEFTVKDYEIHERSSCSQAEDTENKKLHSRSLEICDGNQAMEKEPLTTFWGNCIAATATTNLSYRGAWTYVAFYVNRYEEAVDPELLKTENEVLQHFITHLHSLETQTVFIPHLQHALPTHEIVKQYYRVKKGAKVTVNFLLKRFVFLNTAKNPCLNTKVANQCEESCLENRLLAVVNCSLSFMGNISRKPCDSLMGAAINLAATEKVYKEFDGCNCPRPCDETVISFTSDYQAGEDDEVIFSLNFPDNDVEVITERFSYPFSALLSDIGGNLGFCVGLCLFSFVELTLSTLQMLAHCMQKKCIPGAGQQFI